MARNDGYDIHSMHDILEAASDGATSQVLAAIDAAKSGESILKHETQLWSSCFYNACSEGHFECADAIRTSDELVGAVDKPPMRTAVMHVLSRACRIGDEAVARYVLHDVGVGALCDARMLSEPLHAACGSGNVRMVRMMLDSGADATGTVYASSKPIEHACACGHVAVIRALLDIKGIRAPKIHADDEAAFIAACRGGHLDAV